MNLSIDIARRYLLGKKSTNAINLITGISILGMTIGTAAILLILSVFNGFEDLISKLFNSYNPDIKIEPKTGIYFDVDSLMIQKIYKIPGVVKVCKTVDEIVLFEYEGSQEAGHLKGVDENFNKVTSIDSTIIRGKFHTKDARLNYGVIGSGMFNKLSINPSDPSKPLVVYSALKSSGPLSKDYNTANLYPSGVFTIGSEEDGQYVITNLEFIRSLFNRPDGITALEIKIDPSINEDAIIADLKSILDENLIIKNRYQQDEAFLKIMNIEKWISYLIACLTIALISFNMIGALWMIVLDKKKDIAVLKSMGFTNGNVRKLIMYIGTLIGFIGLLFGLVLAIILYFLQKKFALVEVPPSFMIEAYPISLRLEDIVLVSFTVLGLALLASILPANRAARITAFVRHE